MDIAGLIALVLIFGFIPLLIFGFVALTVVFGGGRSRKQAALQQQETAVMRDIHDGLTRLEKRVESLETILVEQASRPRASQAGER